MVDDTSDAARTGQGHVSGHRERIAWNGKSADETVALPPLQ